MTIVEGVNSPARCLRNVRCPKTAGGAFAFRRLVCDQGRSRARSLSVAPWPREVSQLSRISKISLKTLRRGARRKPINITNFHFGGPPTPMLTSLICLMFYIYIARTYNKFPALESPPPLSSRSFHARVFREQWNACLLYVNIARYYIYALTECTSL